MRNGLIALVVVLYFIKQGFPYCAPPKVTANSSYKPIQNVYKSGMHVRYKCKTGCKLQGAVTRTCIYSQMHKSFGWTFPPPKCICLLARYCHMPSDLQHGTFILSTPLKKTFGVGESIQYSCQYGYKPVGDPHISCQAGGWSHSPKCQRLPPKIAPVCVRPSFLEHGRIYSYPVKKLKFDIGEFFTISCNYGYHIEGGARITCKATGWSHTPKCVVKHHCPRPRSIPNALMKTKNPFKLFYSLGESISFLCNPGHCASGETKIHCRISGWTITSVCKYGSCTLQNDYRTSKLKKHWCPGEKLEFTCKTNYQLIGPKFVACGSDLKWNHPFPKCTVSKCVLPSSVENGWLYANETYGKYFRTGQHFTYGCHKGYCRFANAKVFCKTSGWSHTPICKAPCRARQPPKFGRYVENAGFRCPGVTVRFACDESYVLAGYNKSTCLENGKWSHKIPICKKICSLPATPENGWIFVHKKHQVAFLEGHFFTYGCQAGYCRSGEKDIFCKMSGWSHLPSCRPPCPLLEKPRFGSISNYREASCPGTTVQYQCNGGYTLLGESELTCTANNQWSAEAPVCRKVCFLPVQSNDTFFVESVSKNVFEENESISVSCHPETCLQGVAEIYCKESGWTPVPVCRRGCLRRNLPPNLSYIEEKAIWCPQEFAMFACAPGYELAGQVISLCSEEGIWNSEVPICKSVCMSPVDPLNGFVIVDLSLNQTFSLGDVVVYQCDPGFCLTGDATVSCRLSGWSHFPTCIVGCPHRPPPLYGSYTTSITQWCPGQQAVFQCDEGFNLIGIESSLCMALEGEWSSPVPKCQLIATATPDPSLIVQPVNETTQPPVVPEVTSTLVPVNPEITPTLPRVITDISTAESPTSTSPVTTFTSAATNPVVVVNETEAMASVISGNISLVTATAFVEQTPPPIYPEIVEQVETTTFLTLTSQEQTTPSTHASPTQTTDSFSVNIDVGNSGDSAGIPAQVFTTASEVTSQFVDPDAPISTSIEEMLPPSPTPTIEQIGPYVVDIEESNGTFPINNYEFLVQDSERN